MKVRFHRGGLSESLKTQFEPVSWEDFCNHCKNDCEFIDLDTITCELYMNEPDYRIKGWNKTYIICASIGTSNKNKYPNSVNIKVEHKPFAFSNEDINKLKK